MTATPSEYLRQYVEKQMKPVYDAYEERRRVALAIQDARVYANKHLLELLQEYKRRQACANLPTDHRLVELMRICSPADSTYAYAIAESIVRDAAFDYVLMLNKPPELPVDPCPGCPPGSACRTPSCGRLKYGPGTKYR